MLERFRQAQQGPLDRLRALETKNRMPAPFAGSRPSLAARLIQDGPGAIIAEYKRASPSAGTINLGSEPERVAAAYAEAGASALSVLTEESHFMGDIGFISRMAAPGLPLLRKDFLIDPLQVKETAATPASALLLIVRMLDNATLTAMLEESRAQRLEAVLEIFDLPDLLRARASLASSCASPAIIQVNNRDLDTLEVDDAPSRELIREKSAGEVWISASGVRTAEDVRERAGLGFNAVLVGTSLMRGGDPGAALKRLTRTGDPRSTS